jgi:hypothetical protein
LRDEALHDDLQNMHDVHVKNIANANRQAEPFITNNP